MVADEALHAVVGPLITLALQVFKELSGTATLAFGSFGIEVQPLGQRLLEFTQFRFGGLLTPVLGRFRGGLAKVLANGIAGEAGDVGDGINGQPVHLMHTPYFEHGFHD
jgi:hypothetical protein